LKGHFSAVGGNAILSMFLFWVTFCTLATKTFGKFLFGGKFEKFAKILKTFTRLWEPKNWEFKKKNPIHHA